MVEILVVIVLSAIVIATGAAVYKIVQNTYIQNIKKNQASIEIFSFCNLLKHDLESSEFAIAKQNTIEITSLNNETITYDFDRNSVLRTKGTTKVNFNILVNDLKFEFLNNNSQLLSSVHFSINHAEKNKILFDITKKYSNSFLFNLNSQK